MNDNPEPPIHSRGFGSRSPKTIRVQTFFGAPAQIQSMFGANKAGIKEMWHDKRHSLPNTLTPKPASIG